MSWEAGIKPYIKTDDPHVKRMRRPTWSHQTVIQEEAHSELVKPYEWDNYQEQEHFYPNPLFNPEWPHDMPEEQLIVGRAGTNMLPCSLSCTGNFPKSACTNPIRCRFLRVSGSQERADPNRVWVSYTQNFRPGPNVDVRFRTRIFGRTDLDRFEIYPIRDTTWDDYNLSKPHSQRLYVYYKDPLGSICVASVQVFCTCACPPDVTFEFDDASTPDTIAPGGTISVYIQGGCGPYQWSVSGTGYTLGDNETTSPFNTLTSASGSCGVNYSPYAAVTVTDKCGGTVNFSIRNTGGTWTWDHKVQLCPTWICGSCFVDPSSGHTICYENQYKIDTAWGSGGDYGSCAHCSDDGQDRCGNSHSDWIACEDWYIWSC